MSSGLREGLQILGSKAEKESAVGSSGAERPVAISTASVDLPTTARPQILKDVSASVVPASVTASPLMHEAARILSEKLRQLTALETRSYAQTQAFEQHLAEIVALMLAGEKDFSDLDEEFARVHGVGMCRAVAALNNGASAQTGSRRHLSVARACVQLESARIRSGQENNSGVEATRLERREAWATVLSRDYLRPILTASSSEERSTRIRRLEEVLLDQRRQQTPDGNDPSAIECLMEVHQRDGIDFFVEASKHCSATELALVHALVLEHEPRVAAIQFMRRLETAESLADVVAYFPRVEELAAFEREVVQLTGEEPAKLLMIQSLTLREGNRLSDEGIFRAELQVLEALHSQSARAGLYSSGALEQIRTAATQVRDAAHQAADTETLAHLREQVGQAAGQEGLVQAVREALTVLSGTTLESSQFDPHTDSLLLSARELSLRIETQRLFQGLGLDPAVHLRNGREISSLETFADVRVQEVKSQVLQRIEEVPEGYLREQYLRSLASALKDFNRPVPEAILQVDQEFSKLVQDLSTASSQTTARDFLAQLDTLGGQPSVSQFLAVSRLFSELPEEAMSSIRIHADSNGLTLEERVRSIGGERLLEFSGAVESGNQVLCNIMTLEELIRAKQGSAALNLLLAAESDMRAELVSGFNERNDAGLLEALKAATLPAERMAELELALSGSPRELLRLQCESAMGLHSGSSADLLRFNELLQSMSSEQREELKSELMESGRDALLARMMRVDGSDREVAEILVQLLENGPRAEEQLLAALNFLAQMHERDQVRQEAAELLETRLHQNSNMTQGAESNARELERTMNEQDMLVSFWSWSTGVTSATTRDAENCRQLAGEYRAQRVELLSAQEGARDAAARARAAEVEVLNALVFGRQQAAQDAAQRANLAFSEFAETMNSPKASALPNFDRYNAESAAFRERLDDSIRNLNNCETGLKVARTATIIVGGAVVVVATGGAAIPAWQAALLITAAAAPGTVVQGTMDVQYGNKTTRQAVVDSAWQTGGDFLNAWGAGSLSRTLFSPRVLVTGGGEAIGHGALREGGKYSLREISRIVGQRVGPMWVRDPVSGARVAGMLTEKGLLNIRLLGPTWEGLALGGGLASLLQDNHIRKQLMSLVQPPAIEERPRPEIVPVPMPRAPLVDPIPLELSVEAERAGDEKQNDPARIAIETQTSEVTPDSPPPPNLDFVANGDDAPSDTPPPPPGTPDHSAPGAPPPPAEAGDTTGGSTSFDPLAALLKFFGIGMRTPANEQLDVRPQVPQTQSAVAPDAEPATKNTDDQGAAVASQPGASIAMVPSGNSYTAALQNAQPQVKIASAHLPQEAALAHAQETARAEMQREVAGQKRELELERIRFLEQRNQRAIEDSIRLAERTRRWMEELQAMAQQQLANAIADARATVQGQKSARGQASDLASGTANGMSQTHGVALANGASTAEARASGLSQAESSAVASGVLGRSELQRALSFGQPSGEAATLTFARAQGVEDARREMAPHAADRGVATAGSHSEAEKVFLSAQARSESERVAPQASERSSPSVFQLRPRKVAEEVYYRSVARVDSEAVAKEANTSAVKAQAVSALGTGAAHGAGTLRILHRVLNQEIQSRLTETHSKTSQPLGAELSLALNQVVQNRYAFVFSGGSESSVASPSVVDRLGYNPAVPYHVRLAQNALRVWADPPAAGSAGSGTGESHAGAAINAGITQSGVIQPSSKKEAIAASQAPSAPGQIESRTSFLGGAPTYSFLSVEVPGGANDGDGRLEQYLREEQQRIDEMRESAVRRLRIQRRRKKLRARHRAEIAARRLLEELALKALEHSSDGEGEVEDLEVRVEKLLVARVPRRIARRSTNSSKGIGMKKGAESLPESGHEHEVRRKASRRSPQSDRKSRRHYSKADKNDAVVRSERRVSSRAELYRRQKASVS